MRGLALAIALATSMLIGCEQPADIVGYASAPLSGGSGGGGAGGFAGASGTSAGGAGGITGSGMGATDSGGMAATASGGSGGSEPQAPTCDAMGYAFGLLKEVESDGCVFDARDTQVGALLIRHIFTMEPLVPDPESAPPDVQCNMLSRPPEFFAWARPVDSEGTSWLLCPAYCAVLTQWVMDQRIALQECLPDGGL